MTRYAVPGMRGSGSDIAAGPDGAMWFTDAGHQHDRQDHHQRHPPDRRQDPPQGRPGTLVTITGRNLADASRVAFHGAPATIVSDTATNVVATSPPPRPPDGSRDHPRRHGHEKRLVA